MAKTLELQFVTELGQGQNITVDAPKEPVEVTEVKEAMEAIIASNAFSSSKGRLASIKGARVIERKVTEYEI